MEFSPLDASGFAAGLPVGLAPGADSSVLVTGTLVGADASQWVVQVTVGESEPVWVPASPAVYSSGAAVRLLRSPEDRGRLLFCLGPLVDVPLLATGEVVSVNADAGTLTVRVLGGEFSLPYVAGTYSEGTVVHVLRSASRFGVPEVVLGPQGNFEAPVPPAAGAGNGNPAGVASRERTITPQWSGSWRSAFSRWNSWNTDRFGGPSTLWQGDQWGSGPMTGLAAYGDQVVNLNAVAIDRMILRVHRADTSSPGGRQIGVQGSPNGSQPGGAPSGSGDTATGPSLAPGQSGELELPSSMYEPFRTGGFKGLLVNGSQYSGWLGTSKADGMALTIQYKVAA